MDKNFWYSVSILVGTVVGAGMFALPYIAQQAGFFVGVFYIAVLFFVFWALHSMMAEVALRTQAPHRFVGYVGEYLGERAKKFVMITSIFGVFGGLLAYILLSASFLNLLSATVFPSYELNQIYFWFAMCVILLFGVKGFEKSELAMFLFLFISVALLIFYSIPSIDVKNLLGFNATNIFLPYGPAMYSLAGVAAIPLLRDILKGEEFKLKRIIFIGTLIPAALYVIFMLIIVGTSGSFTTENSLTGLSYVIGNKAVLLGALFGIFAVATSYLSFGLYLKQTLMYDLNISERKSMALVFLVPLLLVFFMPVGFIGAVMFLGAVFGGIEALILVRLFKKAKEKSQREPEYSINISKIFIYFMMFLFAIGIIYEIFSLF